MYNYWRDNYPIDDKKDKNIISLYDHRPIISPIVKIYLNCSCGIPFISDNIINREIEYFTHLRNMLNNQLKIFNVKVV